jgi:hypothetical protein
MRVTIPIDLYNTTKVTSSSIAEPDTDIGEVLYNAGTTYAINDKVIETTHHRTYQSLQAANTGHALPNFAIGETQNDWWVDVGPDNKYAMFDYLKNSQTVGQEGEDLVVEITPAQRMNTVALLGLAGSTVSIEGKVSGDTVYGPLTKSIATRDVTSWYGYFFDPFDVVPSAVFSDLPPEAGLVLTITIHADTGAPKCASVVLGNYTYIGDIEPTGVSDAINFSTVDRDAQGNATLIPRRSIPRAVVKTNADAALINKIRVLRDQLNAVPVLWQGMDTEDDIFHETLLILGFYRTFSITLVAETLINIELDIEEI